MASPTNATKMNLLFDFGGVLVDLDAARCVRAFDAIGFDVRPYLGTYAQTGLFSRLERGELTVPQFCDELRRLSGQAGLTDAQIVHAWQQYLVGVPAERLDMLLRVARHYPLYVLSNTNPIHWDMAVNDYFRYRGNQFSDFFRHAFLSYELSFFKDERKGKKGKERLLCRPIEGNGLGKPLVLLPRKAFREGRGSFLEGLGHPYASLLRRTLRDELLVFPFDEREDTQFLRLLRGGSVSLEEGERCRARLLSSLEAISHLLAFEIDLEVGEKDGRAILLSSKGEEKIPYLLESAGTRKLLLLLSSLAPYLTRRSAWAILDEVDAGIFEYLFGELMRSLYQRGKGSLLFTSHDLRTLETLPHHHARFASLLAEGRFYEIKAGKGENLRDLYLRSLALRSKYPGEDIPAFMRRASRLGGDE